ncbi:uncharacterized protein LOC131144967 [Malania oleifera]|uniref:uncharacterized protein LOC131144967 n=1 Tax=Malania oleifera TaxID=397392 RepID=UPI0025AE8E8D|nr:uncharacterized protein LOC131144967 [Malania oleifera]
MDLPAPTLVVITGGTPTPSIGAARINVAIFSGGPSRITSGGSDACPWNGVKLGAWMGSIWKPNKAQLEILKEAFRSSQGELPSVEQDILFTARLRLYGPIELRNIRFWFENCRRKRGSVEEATISTTVPPIIHLTSSATTAPSSAPAIFPTTCTLIPIDKILSMKLTTNITPMSHTRYNGSITVTTLRVSDNSSLLHHFQEIQNALRLMYGPPMVCYEHPHQRPQGE